MVAQEFPYYVGRHIWLYPNKLAEMVVLVPNENRYVDEQFTITMPPAMYIWQVLPLLVAILLWIFKRILNQPLGYYDFFTIWTDNVGIMLGTTKGLPSQSQTERTVHFTMSLSALTFSMTVISIIVCNCCKVPLHSAPSIDTLDDLAKSNFTLTYLLEDKNWIEGTKVNTLFPNNSERLNEVQFSEYYSKLADLNFTSAFVMRPWLADVYVSTRWTENDTYRFPAYRMLSEKLGNYFVV